MPRMTPSQAFVEHPEPFRRDALGKPVRLLEKYRENRFE